ncbi:acetylgalactosamine-6-sulfatase [Seminavis robusta]|uniref:Acetylgalactosamine-6-sulfatase n=1 Tax=Seminavis robusta TaxID=568900 RepID=A0A9N8EXD8_9STRA|nr:acetylgalactosamine-6-sulfatase [Seminavis robusta]|eukprot:Sro1975_g308810.1 acetylgalactosamine-6-sulfatase (586) ;mRNA; f:12260-14219
MNQLARFLLLLALLISTKTRVVAALRDPLDRPNFVLFFVDDLGYGDLGFTGHPTTSTPNIDRLAWNGKTLTTWYSGCALCSCSRAALMTGRQYPRTGIRQVLGTVDDLGLPLEEVTIAEQLKKVNYTTGIVGKWHLGQRLAYLPGNQGFDYYLGIPYSDDMGNGKQTSCPGNKAEDPTEPVQEHLKGKPIPPPDGDYAAWYLPLLYQEHNKTRIIEQPLDLTKLAQKYNRFATKFIEDNKDEPFFLYFPFNHVHTTSGNNDKWDTMPNRQFASCELKNRTKRGAFGDALAEVDWMIGNVYETLQRLGLEENTMILWTSDNGPATPRRFDAGSYGIFSGEYAGYPWTGKASTWEGGIRMPAFAHWKGQIQPFSRSSQTISSMDVFPTFSHLAGVPLPSGIVLDGRDMADILLQENGQSRHDFLFFYGFCNGHWPRTGVTAVRHGPYKAHFCTSPGLGAGHESMTVHYNKYPLLFNVEEDPSETFPICDGNTLPENDPDARAAIERILRAYAMEKATFEYGKIPPLPPGPGEGKGHYGVCCNRSTNCSCESLWDDNFQSRLFTVGSEEHHARYHEYLGEENHMKRAT